MRIWRIIALSLLSLTLVGATACGAFGGASNKTPNQQLVKVVRGDLTLTVSGSGNIGVAQDAKLTFGTSGRIVSILVKEGDKVTKGQAIARLDTAPFELALLQAQIGLEQAENNLDKAQEKYKWPDIKIAQENVDDAKAYVQYAEDNLSQAQTPSELERWTSVLILAQTHLATAEAKSKALTSGIDTAEVAISKKQVEAAKQTINEAQKQLDRTTLTAPFDGVVISIYIDERDTATATTAIAYLISLSSMELKARVDEIDVPSVKLGQTATITVDALPDLKLVGKVGAISHMASMQSGVVTYDVTISFTIPEDSSLRVGMSATADIAVNERKNVLLVPNRVIKRDSEGNPVVTVIVAGQAQERPVALGLSDGLQTEIISGLQEGEMVVVETVPQTSAPRGFLFGG